MRQLILFISIMSFSLSGYSFPCYLTIVKDNCWLTYDLSVNVLDSSTGKVIGTVIVPQQQSWARQPFTCQPGQTLAFESTFSPVFWSGEENKVYSAKRYWGLPKSTGTDVAWNVQLCFPAQFAEVPMPPEATANCRCLTDNIPDIPSS